MGLQKYRADIEGQPQSDKAIPWFTKWMGGPTLALIRNCRIENTSTPISPRTVYITGEPDSWFSIPAACTYKRKTITGYVTTNSHGEFLFRAHYETSK